MRVTPEMIMRMLGCLFIASECYIMYLLDVPGPVKIYVPLNCALGGFILGFLSPGRKKRLEEEGREYPL